MGGLAGDEGWRRYFETDLMGTVHAVEAAQPFLEKSGAGAIVIIASIAAIEVGHDVFPDGFLQGYGAEGRAHELFAEIFARSARRASARTR
jgi:3-oxoacyl-[acyl-carrier protein] reductase